MKAVRFTKEDIDAADLEERCIRDRTLYPTADGDILFEEKVRWLAYHRSHHLADFIITRKESEELYVYFIRKRAFTSNFCGRGIRFVPYFKSRGLRYIESVLKPGTVEEWGKFEYTKRRNPEDNNADADGCFEFYGNVIQSFTVPPGIYPDRDPS
jgi:hypothetical protein